MFWYLFCVVCRDKGKTCILWQRMSEKEGKQWLKEVTGKIKAEWRAHPRHISSALTLQKKSPGSKAEKTAHLPCILSVAALSRKPHTFEIRDRRTSAPVHRSPALVDVKNMSSAYFGGYKIAITLNAITYHTSDKKIRRTRDEKDERKIWEAKQHWYEDEECNFWGQRSIFGLDFSFLLINS